MKTYAEEPDDPQALSHTAVPVAATIPVPRTRLGLAQWAVAFFLGVIATCLLLRNDKPLGSMALAQPSSLAGARGVFAFTGQLDKDHYGVFMVDVDQGTIWCYELNDKKNLNLLAGRSWRYDRYLEEFNVGNLKPREVEELVEDERKKRLQGAGVPPPPPSSPQTGTQPDPEKDHETP